MIYLDHNATTPIDAEAQKAMAAAFPVFGNPSSGHSIGMAARAVVEQARRQVAGLIACRPSEILFTSGGTESNNLAIIGAAYKRRTGHIITSVIEHPSVLNPARWLEGRGFAVSYLPVGSDGRVSPDDVKKAVRRDTILITVMHANNETGVLQPVGEIGEIARSYGIAFHTDAAQSVGKMDLRVPDTAADMLTIVSHKFYGPKGIGALYIKDLGEGEPPHIPSPVLFGAGHEGGMRPGTENVVCIAGLGAACDTASRHMPERFAHTRGLRDLLYGMLDSALDIRLNGHETLRLPNTLNISIRGVQAEDIIMKLTDSVALSAGSACHSGIRKPSPVLKAMGLSDEECLSAVRLSVGKDNTPEEMEIAAEAITGSVKSLS